MTTPEVAESCETPDLHGAYPRLTSEQIQVLLPRGERRSLRPGDVLFREGEVSSELFVILGGRVAIVERYEGPDERVISVTVRGASWAT